MYYPCLDQDSRKRLTVVQNNCVRFIFGLRKFSHVSSSYVVIQWLRMPELVKYNFLTFLHKLLQTGIPTYLREKLIFRYDVHIRTIRNAAVLTMPHHTTSLFQRSFSYNAVYLYNSIEPYVKNLSITSYKKHIKRILLQSQFPPLPN